MIGSFQQQNPVVEGLWKDPQKGPCLPPTTRMQTVQHMIISANPEFVKSPMEEAFWNSPLVQAEPFTKQGYINRDCGVRAARMQDLHQPEQRRKNPASMAYNDGSGGRLHELLHTMDSRMDQQGLTSRLFHLLQRCIQENDKIAGKEVERYILENGLRLDALLGNSLIRMHTLFEELSQANEIFKKLLNPCVFSWNAIISAHVRFGENNQAITLYHEMCHSGVEPNGHIYVTVLKACSNVSTLEVGRQVHAHVIGNGFESDVFVGSTLIDMYAKCQKVDTAHVVFNKLPNRNVVTWSALIAGYLQHGQAEEALQCSKEMQQEGLQPNEVTFVSLLKACSSIAAQEQGKCIHDQIIESGLEADPFIGSTLVDMYAKCGNLEDAHTVFDRLPSKDLVAWSALIAGYAQCRQGQEALQLFREMVQKGMVPDRVTFICLLQSCSSIAALEHGKLIHMQIIDNGFESDLRIGSTLIDMYAKCGSLDDAAVVLQRLSVRNVVTWSTMIAGCALQSNYPLALQFFEAMQQVGLKPNKVTFISLLSACSHAGRVEEACLHLKSMRQDHGLEPALEHYNSMADLLGRAGYLNEAEDLMDSLPFRPDIVGWTSLLGSCSTHDNVELGRRCFDRVLDEGGCATAYVLMSGIYAHVGMWADAARIRERRRYASVWKKPAKAFIEIDNQVHSFTVGDNSHPRSDDVYAKLKSLSMHMRGKGFNKSNMEFVLGSKSDGDKRDSMCGHSEKLAIAFGLISTPQGTTIRVGKNLRVCADCHTAAKIMSKVELREIIVSDSYSVHHFKDGLCCCNEQ